MHQMHVLCVLPEDMSWVWPQVVPLFTPAFAKAYDGSTLDQLRQRIEQGRAYLLVMHDQVSAAISLAVAIEFMDYPNCVSAQVVAIGGRDAATPGAFDAVLAFVKELGASELRAWVDTAMARFLKRFGFKTSCLVVRRSL